MEENNAGTGSYEEARRLYHDAHYERAFKIFFALANQGHAEAQEDLGLLYELGRGTSRDDIEAVKWYRLAADQGSARAQNSLASKYISGQGIQRDKAEAKKWAQFSAEQGDTSGQMLLGWMYLSGKFGPKDPNKARPWYEAAAKSGNAEAQWRLGTLLRSQNDYKLAVSWYEQSAKQGYGPALYRLAYYYYHGNGVTKDASKSFDLFNEAAATGHIVAKAELVKRLIRGEKGLIGIIKGLRLFMSGFIEASKIGKVRPEDERYWR